MHRHQKPVNSSDPSRYPRTYLPSNSYRISFIFLGVGLIVGLPWMLWTSPHASASLQAFLTTLSVLFGAGLLLATFRYKVVLEPDAITVRLSWSTRRLRRNEIRERQILTNRGGESEILIPRDENEKKLIFPLWLHEDLDFFAWFEDIPIRGAENPGGEESTDDFEDDLASDDISDMVEEAQARMESSRKWMLRVFAAFLISDVAVVLFSERGPFHPYRPSLDEVCFFLSVALLFAFLCCAVAWWDNWGVLRNLRRSQFQSPIKAE
jgi:hypothetical protein